MAATPAEAQGYRSQIGQGWTYMEAGNFRKAEEAFQAAFAMQEGKNAAETYYAIAALWWERRNAMASYMWLTDAEKASRSSFSWDGGPEGEWDSRIAQRRTFIERNFGAVRLRSPSRGNPLPPLVDPVPADPLLKSFTDRMPTVIAEGVAEKVSVQWVVLPAGDYWVGDTLQALPSGQLDAAKAPVWELPRDAGKVRKAHEARVAALERGESPAAEEKAAQELAAKAEADAEAKAAAAAAAATAAAAAKAEGDRKEAARLAQIEADRKAADAKAEADRKVAAAQAEADRKAQAEADRLAAAAQAEADRKAEAERTAKAESDRKAQAAAAQAEADRKAAAAAAAKAEADRKAEADAAAKAEADALAARADNDRKAQAEVERRAQAEADRLAQLDADAKAREAAERSARADREAAEKARLEEQRKADEWEVAQARMREEQDREAEKERIRREQLRQQRVAAGGPADTDFAKRRLSLSAGGGGSTVTRMQASGSSAEVDWVSQVRLDYVAPIKGATVALPIGISWANLPVDGCSHKQTRANTLALHVGPRFSAPIKGRLWFTGQIGAHVGAGASFPTGAAINQCAGESLKADSDGVAYGARLSGAGGATGRLSLGDLGWTQWAVLMGPDGDVGILGAPGAGPTYLGVSFFVRYDQVVPIIRGTAYHFQSEGDSSVELSSVTLETLSGKASMARFQFGLRGRILF
ncbi:MAG: hypothetical protein KDA24_02715 [Deltaproteobacteria bacterium]|nr:hypothetical protein [Deltaproteobacteria bacterium]